MTVLYTYSAFRHTFATVAAVANDGYEVWPSAQLRAAGFTGGFTTVATITQFPIAVSVDGLANGAEAYHVWLSQRTEVLANQYLSLALVSGKSGTWAISLTARAVSELGLAGATSAVNEDQLRQILRHVHLYVQRISDDSIQWMDILRTALG